jgi:hypothetical protein
MVSTRQWGVILLVGFIGASIPASPDLGKSIVGAMWGLGLGYLAVLKYNGVPLIESVKRKVASLT